MARNFRGSLISWIDDFVRLAGRNVLEFGIQIFQLGTNFSRT